MKHLEPCPLNGKDLCGDEIVDEMFDYEDYIHYSKEDKYLGLINGIPTVITYEFDSHIIFVEPLDYNSEQREKVFRAVEAYAKKFNNEESERNCLAKVEASKNYKFQAIAFYYYE